jgi:hypothetical protein
VFFGLAKSNGGCLSSPDVKAALQVRTIANRLHIRDSGSRYQKLGTWIGLAKRSKTAQFLDQRKGHLCACQHRVWLLDGDDCVGAHDVTDGLSKP